MDHPPPAGWYDDPDGPQGQQRWWDGSGWTEHRRPVAGSAPQPPPPPPAAAGQAVDSGFVAGQAAAVDGTLSARDELARARDRVAQAEAAWRAAPSWGETVEALRARVVDMLGDRLAQLPVTLFEQVGVPRASALVDSRLASVADVLVEGKHGLLRVQGIGEKSATAIMDVAGLVEQDAVETLPVRLGDDDLSARLRHLLVVHAEAGEEPAEKLHRARQALEQVPAAPTPFSEPAKPWYRTRRRHEQLVEEARDEHAAQVAAFTSAVEAASGAAAAVPEADVPSEQDAQARFAEQAAAYATRFERLVHEAFPSLYSASGMRTSPVLDDDQFVVRWFDPDQRPRVDLAELARLREREEVLEERKPAGPGLGLRFDGAHRGTGSTRPLPVQRTVRATTADLSTVVPPEEVAGQIAGEPLADDDLAHPLRSYQSFAAKFVLHTDKVVIGDEMGLGKTVEALAAAQHVLSTQQRPQVLVVAPASLIPNWTREITKWLGLDPYVFHNSAGSSVADARAAWLTDGGIAVTTYGSMRLAADEGIDEQLELVVFDEAHMLKNPDTKRTRNAEKLIARSDRVLLMTGTPMTSHISDFVNMVRLVDVPLAGRMAAATTDPPTFRQLVSGRYLRRTQNDVLDELPDIVEVDDLIEPTEDDRAHYEQALRAKPHLMVARGAVGARPSGSKMLRLRELWGEAREDGQSMVVFSYFLDTLKAAQAVLGEDVVGTISGGVSPQERQRLVDELTAADGPKVLLAQIVSGGVGLNIQAASVAVVCEPQFNPSVEYQAIKRLHRMGQTRAVLVHRLISQGLVDEPIVALRDGKAVTFERFVAGSDLATAAGQSAGIELDEAALLNRELNRLRIGADGSSEVASERAAPAQVPQPSAAASRQQVGRAARPLPHDLTSVLDLSGGVVALDFETANPGRWTICEVGLADPEGGVFDTLIDPAAHFAPGNVGVHGIQPTDVAGAPGLEALADLLTQLDGMTVVAHNVVFDKSCVDRLFARLERPVPTLRWVCTLDLARSALPHLDDHRLPTVAKAVDATLASHHTAADDAAAAMQIAQHLAAANGGKTRGDHRHD